MLENGIGLSATGEMEPVFIERMADGFLEIMRLHDGLGHHDAPPAPSRAGPTEAAVRRARATDRMEVSRAGAPIVVPILVHMRKRGQIDRVEERAGLMFAMDFASAYRVSGLISSIYARSDRPKGMDLSLPSERMTPEEARSFHWSRFMDACRAVNHMPTIEALVWLVCEYASGNAADVGRSFIPYKQQQQAQAVGATLVKVGLQKLAKFYGLTS